MLFNFTKDELIANQGWLTLTEIHQQPEIWNQIVDLISLRELELRKFIETKIDAQTKIVLTGAGTSEFIGKTLLPYLTKKGLEVVSIPTTDLVTNLEELINPQQKILLVSFARSGNSPESIATFTMMEKYVKNLNHLVITCNQEGKLAQLANQNPDNLVFVLPAKANDQGFAMTSSYSGMIIAAALIFLIDDFPKMSQKIKVVSQTAQKAMEDNFQQLQTIAKINHQRIVFLGSGVYKGLAQEAHLKVLELSAGEVNAFFNTPVGFRHGPKSILNQATIVFFLMNQEPYARQYDLDLLTELASQRQLDKIVVLDQLNDDDVRQKSDFYFSNLSQEKDNLMNALVDATLVQLYAFFKSLSLEKTPDNPWPSGFVNRVVQGVVIHTYFKEEGENV